MSASEKVSLGTTIISASFDGGVVLGADSRTSTGKYIANRAAGKLTQLAENVYCCRSGSAADTQAITSYVQHYLALNQTEAGTDMPVSIAANVTQKIVYGNKDKLSCGMIIAGWDKYEGGQVYALPLGGTLIKVPYSIGGSGSAYITGFCDKFFKAGMTRQECIEFCRRAVSHAMFRDGSSGGCIRLVIVDKDGVQEDFMPGNLVPVHGEERNLPVWSGFPEPAAAMTS